MEDGKTEKVKKRKPWVPGKQFQSDYYLTQVERIVQKFGTAIKLARAIGVHHSTVSRWNSPVESGNGRGGVIPAHQMKKIVAAARIAGIYLSSEDLDPRPRPNPVPRLQRRRVFG